jgi:outer membrane immunogenic protein
MLVSVVAMRRNGELLAGNSGGGRPNCGSAQKGAERTMKKLLLSIAITAGVTGTALAADIPMKAARPMAAPVVTTNWTGCYVGAGGGYGMWNQDHTTHDVVAIPGAIPITVVSAEATAGGRGWFGTVQVGCDYQVSPRWVIGAFADYDFSGMRGDFHPSGTLLVGRERLRDSWAAGVRVGYLIVPQLLGFVSGGYTQARFSAVDFSTSVPPFVATGLSMDAATYRGWFIGTGYEYALDFLPGLFWKTEYRYASYRERDNTIFFAGLATPDFIRASKDVHTVRSELVWRFNFGGGPVVARY